MHDRAADGEQRGDVRLDGHLVMRDADWDRALVQAWVMGRLAEREDANDEPGPVCRVAAVDEAAAELGISRRQVYVLLARFRAGSGRVTDLVSVRSTGGLGGGRLDDEVESIIRETLRTRLPRTGLLVRCLAGPGASGFGA